MTWTIDALAETEGLSPGQLGLLVEQLTSLPCPANLARKLLNCLVPADTVLASTLACLALWLAGDSSLSADRILLPSVSSRKAQSLLTRLWWAISEGFSAPKARFFRFMSVIFRQRGKNSGPRMKY